MAQDDFGLEAIRRRLAGEQDSRGRVGIMSRGANVYNGGSNAAVVGRMSPGSIGGFNTKFQDQARGLMDRRSQLGSDEEYQSRRINEGYNSQLDNFERLREQAMTANTERMAGQGILRSGINLGQQGEIGGEFQRNVDTASSGRARSLEDVARAILSGHQGIENEWEGMERENTRYEAELARQRAEEEARRVAAEQAAEQQRRAIEAQIAAAQPRADATGSYRPAAAPAARSAPVAPRSSAPAARAPAPPKAAVARAATKPAPAPPRYAATAAKGTQSNFTNVGYTTAKKKTSGGHIVL